MLHKSHDHEFVFSPLLLMQGRNSRGLLLSDRTTAEELIQLVLHSNHSQETPSDFAVYEVSPATKCERRLHPNELPLRIVQEWPGHDLVSFRITRRSDSPNEKETESLSIRRPSPWSRVIDEASISPSFGFKYKVMTDDVSRNGSNDSLSTVRSTGTSSSSAHSSGSEYDFFI
jgi:hypothetical protein